MLDLHSHILPGLDDGAQTLADSRELAKRAAAEGVTTIAATPHVRDDYPTSADEMERGVAEVRDDLAAQGIPVEVLHGGEIALTHVPFLDAEELRRFTIAQGGRYLLVEFPYVGWPFGLEQQIAGFRAAGLTPIIAHPERSVDVQRNPARLADVVDSGALLQVTAASLDGRLGRSAKDAARRLLELELVHLLASDAHTPDVREAGIAAAADSLSSPELARYLTEETPAAIVAGSEVWSPPPLSRRRRRFGIF